MAKNYEIIGNTEFKSIENKQVLLFTQIYLFARP